MAAAGRRLEYCSGRRVRQRRAAAAESSNASDAGAVRPHALAAVRLPLCQTPGRRSAPQARRRAHLHGELGPNHVSPFVASAVTTTWLIRRIGIHG